jgi:hypothetical protein
MKIELECQECKNIFITEYKHRNKKFCSRDCYFNHSKKNNTIGRKKDESVWEIRTCLQCGNEFTERIKHEKKLCSQECRKIWNSKPKNKEDRIQKSKDSLFEKYGVDSLYKLDEFQKKCKDSFYKKYGVNHSMLVPSFKEKFKDNLRKNHILKLIPKLEKCELKLIDEYTVNKNGYTSKPYTFQCLKCDNIFTSTLLGSGKLPICRKCHPIIKNSKLEEIIKDFLNINKINHIDNNRSILEGGEIDIYIPEFNLGIEVNGNYYHSELNGGKNKLYHLNKTMISNNKNIKLIQIFEDEILLKKEITLSRISNLLNLNRKIYARKCVVKEIQKKISKEFLIQNHIQSNSIDNFRYGLFFDGELVSVMTFGNKRKSLGNNKIKTDEYELIRFCNLKNVNVVGGFSKLLSYFIKHKSPKKIITYADIRWSGINPEKTVYHKNNFTFMNNTPPNYWYVNSKNFLNRYHRFTYRKDVLVKEGFDKNKTEWEIMREKGFDRIWDCGSMRFELVLN